MEDAKKKFRGFRRIGAAALSLGLISGTAAFGASAKKAEVTPDLVEQAYIFGYPLVLMDVTKQVFTAVTKAGPSHAPVNQFANLPAFPDSTFTDVVSPNADTLYSSSFLDLSNGPMVLSVPDTNGRYDVMQMMDAWTNVFASPGKRTTGTKKQDFAIVGPHWKGKLPHEVKELRSPTDMVWILGRIQTNGKKDYEEVHALQAQLKLTPLESFGKPYSPPRNVPVDPTAVSKATPVEQVASLPPNVFFGRMCKLMKDNPPAHADQKMVRKFAPMGIKPNGQCDLEKLAIEGDVLTQGAEAGQARIAEELKNPSQMKVANGWRYMTDHVGMYGTDYISRAAVAKMGLGANLPQDAIYPIAKVDSHGQPLNGSRSYRLHFAPGQLPPVEAFWSVTLYNNDQHFVANPIHRYAIGDRNKLIPDADGSVEIYIQNARPEASRVANWLPAPKDDFNLMMRLYRPKGTVIKGQWKPPAIEPVQVNRARTAPPSR